GGGFLDVVLTPTTLGCFDAGVRRAGWYSPPGGASAERGRRRGPGLLGPPPLPRWVPSGVRGQEEPASARLAWSDAPRVGVRTLDDRMPQETGSLRPAGREIVGGTIHAASPPFPHFHSRNSHLNKPDGSRSAPATLAFQPPTAPAVRPRTKYRCSETNTTTGTAMGMTAPPVTTCQP